MLIKRLTNGLSGASVELREANSVLFIRKKACKIEHSKLLEHQATLMRSWDSKLIKMPSIISTGKDNFDNFFIDMNYIEGDSFCHYIANPNILNFKYQWSFAEKLLDHMRYNLNLYDSETEYFSIYSLLTDKLISLNNKLLSHYEHNSGINKLLATVNHLIHQKENVIKQLNVGPQANTIHGDLTLSNIIVTKETLFFIDPIEHYLGNCILGDYFKLLFDLDFKLSFRIEGHYKTLETSVIINISRIMAALTALYSNRFRILPNVQSIFLAVEALRVLQYSYEDIYLSNALLRYVQLKINDATI